MIKYEYLQNLKKGCESGNASITVEISNRLDELDESIHLYSDKHLYSNIKFENVKEVYIEYATKMSLKKFKALDLRDINQINAFQNRKITMLESLS